MRNLKILCASFDNRREDTIDYMLAESNDQNLILVTEVKHGPCLVVLNATKARRLAEWLLYHADRLEGQSHIPEVI